MLTRISLPLLALVAILGLYLGAAPAVHAQTRNPAPAIGAPSQADPAAFVDGLVQQALDLLRNTQQLSDAQRDQRFKKLLDSGFDIPRIARFVLGRYWTSASDADRAAFGDLFEQWIVRTYSQRFKDYSGETVQVGTSRPESDTNFVVASQIVHPNGNPPAKVDWHVRKGEDGQYKIVDVEVEGISMALTQREEFASVIQRNGGSVASLNDALRQKLQAGDVDAGGDLKK
jgi:phospholipid transport system substrate-binding protein